MGIERFFTTAFTFKRMVWSGESSGLVDTGSFDGHMQQAQMELVEAFNLRPGLTYSIWCDDSIDIREQDRISDGTYEYTVKAIQKNDYASGHKHIEILVIKEYASA